MGSPFQARCWLALLALLSVGCKSEPDAGRAAEAAMKSFGVYEAMAPRLVFGKNAAQALQSVESGNAQVGIVALALALAVSLRLAFCTMAALFVVGAPIAYWVAFSRWRSKVLADAVVALPLVLPPTVLGVYILVAIGPRSPLGQGYQRLTGGLLPFSFEGLLVASIFYSRGAGAAGRSPAH